MFIVREVGFELTEAIHTMGEDIMYNVLDTSDCVVEQLKGIEIMKCDGITFDNITRTPARHIGGHVRRTCVVCGVNSYDIKSLLNGEVTLSNMQEGCMLWNKQNNVLEITCKDKTVWLKGKNNAVYGTFDLPDTMDLYDARLSWAERIGKNQVRIVVLLQFKRDIEDITENTRDVFLFVFYYNSEFYIQKIKTGFGTDCRLKLNKALNRGMAARLEVLPDYGF